tara:strand:- start:191 stop:502 length:312 start_codon:yes stop_codon:yes gene_type:complete
VDISLSEDIDAPVSPIRAKPSAVSESFEKVGHEFFEFARRQVEDFFRVITESPNNPLVRSDLNAARNELCRRNDSAAFLGQVSLWVPVWLSISRKLVSNLDLR